MASAKSSKGEGTTSEIKYTGSVRIMTSKFYKEWSGHPVQDLRVLIRAARDNKLRIIWLLGDSSLDNKAWLEKFGLKQATKLYDVILDKPVVRPDVAHCLNTMLLGEWIAINTAVEETTLARRIEGLLPQDELCRDMLGPDDVIICSIGGNDIALRPTSATKQKLMELLTSPPDELKMGNAPALQYFIRLFKTDIESYLSAVTVKTKPSKVLVCMIYYPAESSKQESWADMALQSMGYDSQPAVIQSLIKMLFLQATQAIRLRGTEVVPVPLFQILNPKDTTDYDNRVEPSAKGGEKMARAFYDILFKGLNSAKSVSFLPNSSSYSSSLPDVSVSSSSNYSNSSSSPDVSI
eukprot:gb/GEZN01007756.1/.p1 GENE.gb/GEZN01007756.1/~~gb/GEZN01007756.1/.p1  ORF type:complete len:394 (+),score=65.26 gb/GEZN01007756.1/:130-1182(+)